MNLARRSYHLFDNVMVILHVDADPRGVLRVVRGLLDRGGLLHEGSCGRGLTVLVLLSVLALQYNIREVDLLDSAQIVLRIFRCLVQASGAHSIIMQVILSISVKPVPILAVVILAWS